MTSMAGNFKLYITNEPGIKRKAVVEMGAQGELLRAPAAHSRHHVLQREDDVPSVPAVLGLQPSAMVDHIARVDWSLLDRIPGERGGSQQVVTPLLGNTMKHHGPFPPHVTIEDLELILSELNTHILPFPDDDASPVRSIAGGSVANTIRGLAAGFGVSCGIIGACGDDDQGHQFVRDMSSSGVDLSRLRMKKGPTGQCACLVDADGNRTMRPCLSHAVKLQAHELRREDFVGSLWLVVRYNSFNLETIHAAMRMAKDEGVSISLDLASFEMVRDFRKPLLDILEGGLVDLCFANEDEARELLRGEPKSDPEAAVAFLSKHCRWAVVTLGSKGCIAKQGKKTISVPAIESSYAIDATGAGDLFAGGFLYGLVKGLSLEDCCKVGSCSGGSVVRSLGGEVRPENWQWMYKQMQIKGLQISDFPSNVY